MRAVERVAVAALVVVFAGDRDVQQRTSRRRPPTHATPVRTAALASCRCHARCSSSGPAARMLVGFENAAIPISTAAARSDPGARSQRASRPPCLRGRHQLVGPQERADEHQRQVEQLRRQPDQVHRRRRREQEREGVAERDARRRRGAQPGVARTRGTASAGARATPGTRWCRRAGRTGAANSGCAYDFA